MGEPLLSPDFLRKLDQLSIASKRVFVGRTRGERRSRKRGTSIEFADFRNYAQGDDTRFVDWNIYARLDRLFLKLFFEEEDLGVYILLDQSLSMSFGDPTKLEYGKKVAAALGYIALKNLDRISIGGFSSTLMDVFPLTRGKNQVWRMIDFLQSLQPDGETSLATASRYFSVRSPKRGILICISDFFDPAGYEDAIKLLVQLNYDLYVIQVLAEEEVKPELLGHFKLLDVETEREMEVTVDREVAELYRSNLSTFCGGLRDFCVHRGAAYLNATTQVPFEQVVLRYLRQAGLISGR